MPHRTPSPRLIAGASRHPGRNRVRSAAIIALSFFIAPGFFPSMSRRSSSIRYHISVSSLVSFYLVSYIVSSIYRLVYQCRIRYTVPSGLAHRVLLVPRLIARCRI